MLWLGENFQQSQLHPRLTWRNEPPEWRVADGWIRLATAGGTDFWQGTHYGFRADNGHALLAHVEGDFVLTTEVRAKPVHQYDQAGLMVRLSERCWLKCSVEFEPDGPSRLGAVVTNHGWSDWSTQDIDPESGRHAAFRVTRTGPDYLIEATQGPGAAWRQIRLCRLHDDAGGTIDAGLYACSPKAAGFEASFDHLRIDKAGR
jgi:regulation of enolase protein 1 (concanavalin A-like superfamily)